MLDCLVIGGGQSGLACGYYLHKRGLDFRILDAEPAPGGAWQHTWDSLRLFSPATASNLPGMPMPAYPGYPPASHVVDYLRAYEKRYDLPVNRPVTVTRVDHRSASHEDSHGLGGKDYFVVALRGGDAPTVTARTVVAATGTWSSPFIPFYPGHFRGKQWHSAWYPGASPFAGARVAVVGGANSGAQIAADLLGTAARVDWFTHRPPRWMPDDIDGRDLFHRSRARLLAQKGGPPRSGFGVFPRRYRHGPAGQGGARCRALGCPAHLRAAGRTQPRPPHLVHGLPPGPGPHPAPGRRGQSPGTRPFPGGLRQLDRPRLGHHHGGLAVR